MAKTIKSLVRISMLLRNLGTTTSYAMTKRFVETVCTNKETLVSARPHLVNNFSQELSDSTIQDALRCCTLTSQIFDIVQANISNMSANDAILALNALVDLEKKKSEKRTKMCEKNEFLMLCEVLKKNIRHVEPGECVTALKVMVHFNVPTTSIIVQMILQMIRNSVNHLPLQKISFLHFLLLKCESTPLVEALKKALPIVYENNVITKLDRDNIHQIQHALSYLCEKSNNADVFNVIIHSMMNCKEPMDTSLAISVLWSLCDLTCYTDELPEILNHVQNILAENVTSINRRIIVSLLKMISEKIKQREAYYYHEGFIDACASAAISEDWGFTDAIHVLEKLIAIGHTNISLLDYIAGKCFEDSRLLESCPPSNIAILVNGLSVADYKPIFWDAVKNYFLNDRVLEEITKDYPLSKLAVSLLSLDCYCPKILEKTFEKCAGKIIHSGLERGRILLLYQAVKTLYPQYTGPLPINDASELFRTPFKFQDFPLLEDLECALGGSRYVLTNIRSKLWHAIDHAVIMRKGGFPVAINNEPTTEAEKYPIIQLDDLKPPADNQVILVLCIPRYAYSINTQRMKGNWSLKIKTLEALSGYTVIPIRSSMWTTLPVIEKIPYLMQAIRLKCDEASISANS